MYFVVGLGNPGEVYQHSRHNVGWLALDTFCVRAQLPPPLLEKKYRGRTTTGSVAGLPVVALYPETFMNHSGRAVAALVPKSATATLIVVYDDIDLPFGTVRVAFGRGAGGHNGVASIVTTLGTKDFIRIRIGIGKVGFWPWEEKGVVRRPAGDALAKYVLGDFSMRERGQLASVCERAAAAIIDCITQGHTKAMNLYNQDVV